MYVIWFGPSPKREIARPKLTGSLSTHNEWIPEAIPCGADRAKRSRSCALPATSAHTARANSARLLRRIPERRLLYRRSSSAVVADRQGSK
jgi:cob(I)alamin adenosyltransferase